jgi:hypothetical protein
MAMLILAVVGASGLWARQRVRREVERELAAELGAVLDTATQGLLGFMENCERLASVVAQSPEVRAAASQTTGGDALARVLAPYLATGQFTGYVLTDGNGVVLATGGGFGIVGERLLPSVFPRGVPSTRKRPSVGLPFRDAGGRVRAIVAAPLSGAPSFLGLVLDHRSFTASLLVARAGGTGETYAFDRNGRMISTSRFPHHLRAAGLLEPDEDDSALRIELRDPGIDLTTGMRAEARRQDQPLTFMAAAATAGRDGVSVAPYRDYRGVPVVGAWRWLPDREIGVASEIDAAQAFEPLGALERVFQTLIALLGLAGAGLMGSAVVTERARLSAAHSAREARRVGEYILERRLGAGAMGEVYLARHALLRRPTAVKLLRPERTSAEAVTRFEREVRVTSNLTHPNTVAIYDYGRTEEGAFYYAMEYLDGIDLEGLVAGFGPMPEARVIHLLRQACDALGEGHDAGIIHRDVKLANLHLCARGGVPDVLKVLDFGLVKEVDDARVTHAGGIVGTPEYMAPELFESSENASVSSDIYALGCVAYSLLTGRRPFSGSSLAELCNAHLSKQVVPPSRRLRAPVDPTLERLILSCLSKRPAERPRSTREIVMFLELSARTGTWTREDADAFWAAHRDRIATIIASRGGA